MHTKKTNQNILFAAVLVIAVFAIFWAAALQNAPRPGSIGTQELTLSGQDLQQLGMGNGSCQTEEYQTSEYSPLAQYTVCWNYTINSLNDTQVFLEVKKFANFADLNGTYQYESVHLRSADGLISQNDFGDQSRFYVNNENDYGAEFNPPGVYYYALYMTKNNYLIYITSSGRSTEAQTYVANIGRQILSKFSVSTSAEKTCTDSGGTLTTSACCLSSGDFPNTCLIGACGCSPDNSHEVRTCDCGEGKCFDGTRCVPQ